MDGPKHVAYIRHLAAFDHPSRPLQHVLIHCFISCLILSCRSNEAKVRAKRIIEKPQIYYKKEADPINLECHKNQKLLFLRKPVRREKKSNMGNNVKGSFLAMMILLFSYGASAFRMKMNNSSASQCSASGLEECPLDVDLANLVVFADPQTSLKETSLKLTGISNIKNATPDDKCGRAARPGQPYNPCIPNPNDIKKAEHCKTIYKDNNRNRQCK
ncbi:hypothetical protein GQ457_11G004680 [Hibiscus cannabinus]